MSNSQRKFSRLSHLVPTDTGLELSAISFAKRKRGRNTRGTKADTKGTNPFNSIRQKWRKHSVAA
jgi:hypothetical protein